MAREVSGAAHAASGGTVADIARRHDPDAFTVSLARRDTLDLPFDAAVMPSGLPVMLDTNFYIERQRRKLPNDVAAFVESRTILHSGVACAELAVSAGILDPAHPGTAQNRAAIMEVLEAVNDTEIVQPSAAAWAEAGMIAGILARTQHLARPKKALSPVEACCQEGLRRKLINDALLFLSACEQGAILVSMNSRDMDLLLRFRPEAHVLLFRPAEVPVPLDR